VPFEASLSMPFAALQHDQYVGRSWLCQLKMLQRTKYLARFKFLLLDQHSNPNWSLAAQAS
jgi:hypothetical protein